MGGSDTQKPIRRLHEASRLSLPPRWDVACPIGLHGHARGPEARQADAPTTCSTAAEDLPEAGLVSSDWFNPRSTPWGGGEQLNGEGTDDKSSKESGNNAQGTGLGCNDAAGHGECCEQVHSELPGSVQCRGIPNFME